MIEEAAFGLSLIRSRLPLYQAVAAMSEEEQDAALVTLDLELDQSCLIHPACPHCLESAAWLRRNLMLYWLG